MDKIIGQFRMKVADRIYHDHTLDLTAYKGLMRRLPDRTLVYTVDYEQRLREYEERMKANPESNNDNLPGSEPENRKP